MTLFGPDWDVEPEWECSPTEMKRLIEQKKLYDKIQKEKEKMVSTSSESEKEGDGVMWGLGQSDFLCRNTNISLPCLVVL